MTVQRRVAFVTGASSGIGRATAEAFVRAGYATALVDRDDSLGQEVESALRSAGECKFIRCDVTDEVAVASAVPRLCARTVDWMPHSMRRASTANLR